MLGGIVRVAYFMNSHEQTQSNQVCWFHFLVYSLLSKDLTIQNLSMLSLMLESIMFAKMLKRTVSWLIVLGKRPFETVLQSMSGRLPERGEKR